jgi:hypothetical protein
MSTDAPLSHEEIVGAVRSEQERAVAAAYKLENEIVGAIKDIRAKWVDLAGFLYEFQQSKGWATLGYETLEHWLAGPDIEMSRRSFFALTEAHRELVVNHLVEPSRLVDIDMTKAMEVLPALRRGQVDVDTALADCEVLTRTDLRDRYSPQVLPPLQQGHVDDAPIQPDDFHYEKCPSCGSKIKVMDK